MYLESLILLEPCFVPLMFVLKRMQEAILKHRDGRMNV